MNMRTRICSQTKAAYSRLLSVRTGEEFRAVYRKGRYFSDRQIVLYLKENGYTCSRLGVSVSGKSGNSVIRHRFTRLVREVFRLNAGSLPKGYDFVVVAKKDFNLSLSDCLHYYQMERKLLALLKRSGVYHSQQEMK